MSPIPPADHLYKATWSGTLGTPEIFVYSRWMTSDETDQEVVIDGLTGSIGGLFATSVAGGPFLSLESFWPSHVAWTQLKVSPWDKLNNRLTIGQTPAYRTLTDTPTGSTGNGLPYQCAIAITTRSTLAHKRKYNRWYLPSPTVIGTDGQGHIVDEVASALGNAYHGEYGVLTTGSPFIVPCNYNPGQAPYTFAIEDFYVGQRVDTIRRRRDEAPEGRFIIAT
jgi:hypothetical protein